MTASKQKRKICLVSSSGGHYEQLKMLKKLGQDHDIFFVTEKTGYDMQAKYTVKQDVGGRIRTLFNLIVNSFIALSIWIKEKPDVVISTGTTTALPFILLAKMLRKKVIYIETFARVYGGTKAGNFVYKHHLYDLFIYQWETQKEHYPDGVYGGGIY